MGTVKQAPPPLHPICTSTPALQEKVAEVETRLREQLSESERRLNEARREHTKAGEMGRGGGGLLGRRKC